MEPKPQNIGGMVLLSVSTNQLQVPSCPHDWEEAIWGQPS